MRFKSIILSLILFSTISLSAQRYITPTSDLILDANFLLRNMSLLEPSVDRNGSLPGAYFSYHNNAPFGRTYLQTSYNTGDLESTDSSIPNLNVNQLNVSLGYAHHVGHYYPACNIMNPFLVGLVVKADLMNSDEPTLMEEFYSNAYSVDLLLGHDFNFNSLNRIEVTLYTPIISYYTAGRTDASIEIEESDKHIGSGETSLFYGDRKVWGGNIIYHLYFNESFGLNFRYNIESERIESPINISMMDHQVYGGIVLHFGGSGRSY